jgi:ATP-dependent Lon protease
MATTLASAITGRPVRSDLAMTGEITLRGRVLPIGGLKEKALGAQRAGIDTVLLPKKNEPELDELPEATREQMTFTPVETIDEVLMAALLPLVVESPTDGLALKHDLVPLVNPDQVGLPPGRTTSAA